MAEFRESDEQFEEFEEVKVPYTGKTNYILAALIMVIVVASILCVVAPIWNVIHTEKLGSSIYKDLSVIESIDFSKAISTLLTLDSVLVLLSLIIAIRKFTLTIDLFKRKKKDDDNYTYVGNDSVKLNIRMMFIGAFAMGLIITVVGFAITILFSIVVIAASMGGMIFNFKSAISTISDLFFLIPIAGCIIGGYKGIRSDKTNVVDFLKGTK